jgi:uncharacterized membrane protein
MMKKLRYFFITGMVILVPLAVTCYVVWTGFNIVDGWLRDWVKIDGRVIPGLGLLLLVSITLLVGFVAHNFIGRKLISLSEDVVARIPLVNKIYSSVRQISQTILTRDKNLFQEVVAIQYPSKGIWTVGFVTSTTGGELNQIAGEPTVMVFVCTVPNPTSGFVLAVPRREAIPLKMTVEEAIRLVLSAGVAMPDHHVKSYFNESKPIAQS